MNKNKHTLAFTFVEAIIVIVAFFIIMAAAVPTLSHLKDTRIKNGIQKNIERLKHYSDNYFEENNKLSVSFFELVGPQSPIPSLQYYEEERYPEIIFKGERIKLETKRFGVLSSED